MAGDHHVNMWKRLRMWILRVIWHYGWHNWQHNNQLEFNGGGKKRYRFSRRLWKWTLWSRRNAIVQCLWSISIQSFWFYINKHIVLTECIQLLLCEKISVKMCLCMYCSRSLGPENVYRIEGMMISFTEAVKHVMYVTHSDFLHHFFPTSCSS